MKKNILCGVSITFFLLMGVKTFANPIIDEKLLESDGLDPIALAYQKSEKSHNVEEQLDIYLKHLLKVPFEQRQYVFPALFDIPNMPKKIRTHPEIAIWKGKLPTDIAPDKKAFAEKYLKDLNPALFAYLAPRGPQKEPDAPFPSATPLFENQGAKVIRAVPQYPSFRETLKQPEELIKNPNLARLEQNDIEKIDKGLTVFNLYLYHLFQGDEKSLQEYKLLAQYHTDPDEEKINPFQAKIERLTLIKQIKPLDEELQKIGFQSAKDFAIKTDALVRAYRASQANYALVLQTRKYKNITPLNDVERMLKIGARMYEAYPKDVYLVLDNTEVVQQIFIKNGFPLVLNTEIIDAARK